MRKDTDLIWYASYGSNLNLDRFLCYVAGGRPSGSQKEYSGCTDKTAPIACEQIYISAELYFAKSSKSWNNQGVAFLKNCFSPHHQTLGRMYLITKVQFVEIIEQEIDKKNIIIDFDKTRNERTTIVVKKSWYGKIIYIGVCISEILSIPVRSKLFSRHYGFIV